jgi:hypothetical protein
VVILRNKTTGTMGQIPLFDFAFHDRMWLNQIAEAVKSEPWVKPDRFHVLQTYLKANFEIAKRQNLIYEDSRQAIWKPDYLLSKTNEPIYLIYKLNT